MKKSCELLITKYVPSYLIISLIACAPAPVPSSEDHMPIDIVNNPEMELLSPAETLKMIINDIDFTIKLKATYKISAIVLSKKGYSNAWQGKMAPFDLALVWGELLQDELYKKIKWWQEARWYHWRYDNNFPKDNSFIARYSSNNHIIPANDNILNVLKNIKKGDTLELSGFLVDIIGKKDNDSYWWYSSISINDTGDGSCEVLYVKKIRLKGKVYQ